MALPELESDSNVIYRLTMYRYDSSYFCAAQIIFVILLELCPAVGVLVTAT
jgi:hypothetical protein